MALFVDVTTTTVVILPSGKLLVKRLVELLTHHELAVLHVGPGPVRVDVAMAWDAIELVAKRASVPLADHQGGHGGRMGPHTIAAGARLTDHI